MTRRRRSSASNRCGRRGFTLVELLVVIGVIAILSGLLLAVFPSITEAAKVRETQNLLTQLDQAVQTWELAADRRLRWGVDGVPDGAVYELRASTPHVLAVSELLARITRVPEVRQQIASISPDNLYTFDTSEPAPRWIDQPGSGDPDQFNAAAAATAYATGTLNGDLQLDGMIAVLDAWGTPLRMVHPGRAANPQVYPADAGALTNDDGTIFVQDGAGPPPYTGCEATYGIAVNRRIAFVSAGPDQRFGDLETTLEDEYVEILEYRQTLDNLYSYDVIKELPE